ncbi:MAG: ATP-binding sensor histidine kinase [Thermodesulfobacteriota bacterium]|nr:ATP-binding sensor histidine kinase [Thermodesulfobacteriota bacterium]
MEQMNGYQLLDRIHGNDTYSVYKAIRQADAENVIIKRLSTRNPSQGDMARFKQEYELIKNIDDIDGIITIYDLVSQDGAMAIVMEDMDAISLKAFIDNAPMTIPGFLALAIKLAEILGRLHQKNIIHKDIKPHNILINPVTRELKITDFGISRLITREHEAIYNPEVIEGTLKYISPEQTGRINRGVDYRTDLYSLGVTFYEMLTGAPPFEATDPMELIHAHIAGTSAAPATVNPDVPEIISDMVLKLLAKSAEDRYQNAFGVLYDLKRCQEALDENGIIKPFPLATNDPPLTFTIPHICVGREKELARLLAAFDRCANQGGPEIALVTGYTGIGKTFLINEINKPITARKGYFISAKYEQLSRDVPYNAIIQAFNRLIRQILTENAHRINAWQQKLQQALGKNGRVITDVIPRLSLIIGEQPAVPGLGAEEARNRFQYVFKNFIRAFADSAHPLVLFLDDLQWADYASFKFIESVFTDPGNGAFFLIGACRDNELNDHHPLHAVLHTLDQSKIPVGHYRLEPLAPHDIRQYLTHCLRLSADAVEPLAAVTESKTRGNPFFINQFLKTLHQRKLIAPDPDGTWTWDMPAIEALAVTDNVIDLMADAIVELPAATRDALKLAACIGGTFDLMVLPAVMEKELEDIVKDLSPAHDAGLVYYSGDQGYFLHDRIHEAAYSLIPEAERPAIHHAIGRYMHQNTPADKLGEMIFPIINQLNAGRSVLTVTTGEHERIELAGLKALAGEKAMAAAAYQPAFAYFTTGVSLLETSDWTEHYDLCHRLYIQAAESARLNGDLTAMDTYLEMIMANATDLMDRLRAYEIRIQAYTTSNKLSQAVDTARAVMPQIGFDLPETISGEHLMKEFARTDDVLADKTDDDILCLPFMTDPYQLATFRVLTSASMALYSAGHTSEIALIVLRMIRLSIEKGTAPQSAFWFSCYAMTLYTMNQMEAAFRFADIALALKKKFPLHREIRTDVIVYATILHWKRPLREVVSALRDIYSQGMEAGDIEGSHQIASTYSFLRYADGAPLGPLREELDYYIGAMRTWNMLTSLNYTTLGAQTAENLMVLTSTPTLLEGSYFSEKAQLSALKTSNDQLALFLVAMFSMQLSYLFGDIDRAIQKSVTAKKYLPAASGGQHHIVQFYFYRSLVRLAWLRDQPTGVREEMLPKINYAQQRLRSWAAYAPENLRNKIELLEAEISRIRKADLHTTVTLYENAINSAHENELLHEEALAFELAAGFYQNQGLNNAARLYLGSAMTCYKKWGAANKVKHIMDAHPGILAALPETDLSVGTERDAAPAMLDTATVVKASQTIAGEIVLENLLPRLLRIGIENAGAENGALIFEHDGVLFAEARTDMKGEIETTGRVPLDACDNLPKGVINYVHATGENVVIADAAADDRFARDACIVRRQIKSILCVPLRHQKRTLAIFYAENNLTTHAFTAERLELLTILSTQAAISIENARLFQKLNTTNAEISDHRDHLEEMVAERTRELMAAKQEQIEKADIAAGVLHNVGNVLNSVRTSIYTIDKTLKQSKGLEGLGRANQLLSQHMDHIDDFIANDPKGKKLLEYYLSIGDIIDSDKQTMSEELKQLEEKNKIISNIISAQQTYACAPPVLEVLDIADLINDALTMQSETLKKSGIQPICDFKPIPPVKVEKTKLIHVLINIIRNARDAMNRDDPAHRTLNLCLYAENGVVRMEARDSGHGIQKEHLEQIFANRFTTKEDGHGFGLHTSANYMTEMGGRMWAESDGPGSGSTFILEFPVATD